MLFMMKVSIPVETGNRLAIEGRLGQTIQQILGDMKPEAVYFTDDRGQRTGYVFANMDDASEIPSMAEPWFIGLDASVEFHPVMRPQDLAKATGAIERVAKQYGSRKLAA